MRASVIVIDWHRAELTSRALAALEAQVGREHFEIVLVVNEADPADVERFRRDFPRVVLVVETMNTGFAGGVSAGVAGSRGDVVVLVNNDAVPSPDFVAAGLRHLDDHPELAAVAGRVELEGGFVEIEAGAADADSLTGRDGRTWRRDPAGATLLNSTGVEVDRNANGVDRDWLRPIEDTSGRGEVFAFSGAAVFLRRPLLEAVGGFDPSLFMYYEDLDVAWRLRLAGFAIGYCDAARIVHRHAASSASSGQLVRYRSLRNRLAVTARNGTARLTSRVVVRTLLRLARDLVDEPYLDAEHRRRLLREIVPLIVDGRRSGRRGRATATVSPRALERAWFTRPADGG